MTIAMAAVPSVLTVDDLVALRCKELERVFREGCVPERFSALNGRPKGRVLAVAHLDQGPLFAWFKAVTGLKVFPWDGKSFASTGKRCGGGYNRINLLAHEAEWFAFKTRVGPSTIDDNPCILVDYDLPRNRWPVRRLQDELREVSPGLYLGQVLWRRGRRARTLLWFAIDARVQC